MSDLTPNTTDELNEAIPSTEDDLANDQVVGDEPEVVEVETSDADDSELEVSAESLDSDGQQPSAETSETDEIEVFDENEPEAPVVEKVESPYDRPGSWYVVHTYAGYEQKVKGNLENRIASMNMEDKIFECVIPME